MEVSRGPGLLLLWAALIPTALSIIPYMIMYVILEVVHAVHILIHRLTRDAVHTEVDVRRRYGAVPLFPYPFSSPWFSA